MGTWGSPTCLWFKLNHDSNGILKIRKEKKLHLDKYLQKMIFQNERDMFNYIEDNARFMNFTTAMNAFRDIKRDSVNSGISSLFSFWGGFKPMYFLLK